MSQPHDDQHRMNTLWNSNVKYDPPGRSTTRKDSYIDPVELTSPLTRPTPEGFGLEKESTGGNGGYQSIFNTPSPEGVTRTIFVTTGTQTPRQVGQQGQLGGVIDMRNSFPQRQRPYHSQQLDMAGSFSAGGHGGDRRGGSRSGMTMDMDTEPTVSFRLHCHPHYIRRTELPAEMRRIKRSWSVPEIIKLSGVHPSGKGDDHDGDENGGKDGKDFGLSKLMEYREVHDCLVHSQVLKKRCKPREGDLTPEPTDENEVSQRSLARKRESNDHSTETLAAIKMLLAGEARRFSSQTSAPAHGHQARNVSLSGSGIWGWDGQYMGGADREQVDGSAPDFGPVAGRKPSRSRVGSAHSHPVTANTSPKRSIPRRTSSSGIPVSTMPPYSPHGQANPPALNANVIENYAHYVCSRRHNSIPSHKPRHIKIVFHNPNWGAGGMGGDGSTVAGNGKNGHGETVYDGRDYDPMRRASQQKREVAEELALKKALEELEPLSPQVSPTTILEGVNGAVGKSEKVKSEGMEKPKETMGIEFEDGEGKEEKYPHLAAAATSPRPAQRPSMLPRRVVSSSPKKPKKKVRGERSSFSTTTSHDNSALHHLTTSLTRSFTGGGGKNKTVENNLPDSSTTKLLSPKRARSAPSRQVDARISAFTEDVYLGFEKSPTAPLRGRGDDGSLYTGGGGEGGLGRGGGGGVSLKSPTGSLRRLGGRLGRLMVGVGSGGHGPWRSRVHREGVDIEEERIGLSGEERSISSVLVGLGQVGGEGNGHGHGHTVASMPRFERMKDKERERQRAEAGVGEKQGFFKWFGRDKRG